MAAERFVVRTHLKVLLELLLNNLLGHIEKYLEVIEKKFVFYKRFRLILTKILKKLGN